MAFWRERRYVITVPLDIGKVISDTDEYFRTKRMIDKFAPQYPCGFETTLRRALAGVVHNSKLFLVGTAARVFLFCFDFSAPILGGATKVHVWPEQFGWYRHRPEQQSLGRGDLVPPLSPSRFPGYPSFLLFDLSFGQKWAPPRIIT